MTDGTTAHYGADSGKQLRKGKRLDQVVISPEFQPFDPVFDGIECGQKNNRHFSAKLPEFRDDIPTAFAGKQYVEDKEIIIHGACLMKAIHAVISRIYYKTTLLKALHEIICCFPVIFNN